MTCDSPHKKNLRRARTFFGTLEGEPDLLRALQDFCTARGVRQAVVSAQGLVSDARLGAYDRKQCVFATELKNGPSEIAALTGNVFPLAGTPFASLWAVLVNEAGSVSAGRLFSPCPAEKVEFHLTELSGCRFHRSLETAMAYHPLVCGPEAKTATKPGGSNSRTPYRIKAIRINRTRRNAWKST
ncbi:MAG: PPC domain-containing DNA-binding protein [Thermodesulfobacteriota bacterium]